MIYIYAFECLLTGRAYIGCTRDVPKRAREHRGNLRRGQHKCSALLSDWNAHGQSQFRARVLESLPDDAGVAAKRDAELRWMRRFKDDGLLYNEHIISFQPPEEGRRLGVERSRLSVGRRWTPEANLKRSLAQKGRPKGHGAKISATKRANRLARLQAQVMR